MSKKILLLSLVFLMIFAFNINNALSLTEQFSATASIASKLIFSVALFNADTANTFDFGAVPIDNTPRIARNGSDVFTYAEVTYDTSHANWAIKVYTDNTNAGASPRYTGDGNLLYGNLNDGTGLIGNGSGATTNNSTPIKAWCDCKAPDGSFAKGPCQWWVGSAANQFVPDPAHEGGETSLYWKSIDMNLDGTNGNYCYETNEHWTEAAQILPNNTHPAYDVNGDGDTGDDYTTLGKVFEWSYWMQVTADKDVVAGANTAILYDSQITCGQGFLQSGNFKTYFAITDDLAGTFDTDQLIFEMESTE